MRQSPPASWFATSHPFRSDATVHQLVAEAAERYGERPALVDGSGALITHAELDRVSGQVCSALTALGAGRGAVVGLWSDHTPRAIAVLLGIMRSGAAYVPLDPRWPTGRVANIVDQLGVPVLFTEAHRLRDVEEIWWDRPALHTVVLLDVDVEQYWQESLQPDAVRDLWDEVARSEDPLQAAGFNITPRGRRYSGEEVAAYVDHVVGLARSVLSPSGRVVEIGCGSGLLLDALAPSAGRYLGVDPSPVATGILERRYAGSSAAVDVVTAFAHEMDRAVAGRFDLALLASTVQFFPDTAYLSQVLTGLLDRVEPGGAILVADVLDPELSDHAGLRIPASFFRQLAKTDSRFGTVDVLGRDDLDLAGELRDRYDVVLHVQAGDQRERGGPSDGSGVAAIPAPVDRKQLLTWHTVEAAASAAGPAAVGEDTAYVIFTSGSTGVPKGVEVRHRSVVNLIEWVNRSYSVVPADRLLFVTAFAFDLSVYDIFGMLAAGASIRVVNDEGLADPSYLARILETEPITFWDSAPVALSAVLPFLLPGSDEYRQVLRLVLLSGDWVPLTMPAALWARFPRARLVALGGATECTVWSNHFPVVAVDPEWPSIPYGKPIQNARYYVLDERGEFSPIGAAGDLWIAGECVAVGYVGDAELTASRFRPDPWAPATSASRMYRTGDRARWLPDGNLQFLGRLDDQVKVRGYRIELGEVRSALAQCPGVLEPAVITLDTPYGPELAAFYVGADEATPEAVREALRCRLPSYSVPARLVRVPVMPVSATGKTDRGELLRRLQAEDASQPSAPELDTEDPRASVVAQCWSRVLGAPPGAPTADFFAAGGTSLLAARLAALLRERLGVFADVRTVLDAPTLGELTAAIYGLSDAGSRAR